ncbi:hypothetical protein [Niallia sp. FSL K6-0077]|uniref:hypothetical protein n=1 Tax=Niallia sp. FSL K6-0077 TaxID=2954743 RepID=UPI0030F5E3F3
MSDKEKKRIALTGKNIPDNIYDKLVRLGEEKRVTPYITHLMEKEETMDAVISSLPTLLSEIRDLKGQVASLHDKLERIEVASAPEQIKKQLTDKEQDIKIGDTGIDKDKINTKEVDIDDIESELDF